MRTAHTWHGMARQCLVSTPMPLPRPIPRPSLLLLLLVKLMQSRCRVHFICGVCPASLCCCSCRWLLCFQQPLHSGRCTFYVHANRTWPGLDGRPVFAGSARARDLMAMRHALTLLYKEALRCGRTTNLRHACSKITTSIHLYENLFIAVAKSKVPTVYDTFVCF